MPQKLLLKIFIPPRNNEVVNGKIYLNLVTLIYLNFKILIKNSILIQ